jgi:hypothetical protein
MVRVGTGFHETFKLDRSRLIDVLQLARENDERPQSERGFTKADLDNSATSLGPNMRRAFPRYGVAAGLLKQQGTRYLLTDFGQLALGHDSLLDEAATQWLMHYHLSASQGPGPLFWNLSMVSALSRGDFLTRHDVERSIMEAQSSTRDGAASQRLLQSTTTIFFGTYTDSAGLSRIDLMRSGLYADERFELAPPSNSASVWAFGFALVDHWLRAWQDQLTVSLDRLRESDSPAKLLFLDEASVEAHLEILQQEGLIELYRIAPPYQIARRWADSTETAKTCLERMFQRGPQ